MNQNIVVYDPVVAEIQHDRLTDQILGWVNNNNANMHHRMELHQVKKDALRDSKAESTQIRKKANAAYQRKLLKTALVFVSSHAFVAGMQANVFGYRWAFPASMLMLLYGVWLAGGLWFEWRSQCKRGR